jgi:O-antigen/teichoic acid export membrane protein
MSRVSKNILYNLFGQGLLVILGFVAVKFIFKRLGQDALGIIYFTFTLNALLTALLALGINETTVREVAAFHEEDPTYIKHLLQTASFFYWSLYVLAALALYESAPWLVTKWINLDTLSPFTATQILRVLGMASLLALPRSFYASTLRGIQRMEFTNLIDVGASALQQFGAVVVLFLGGGLIQVTLWMAGCYLLGLVVYLMVCADFFGFKVFVPRISTSVVDRNAGYTFRLAGITVLSMIHMQSDKAIVSKLLSLGVFGYYGMAYSAVSRGMLVSASVSQAVFPSFSALYKQGNRDGLMRQYKKLQDLLCYAIVPMFAAIPFAARPLFTFVLNAEAARMLLWPVTFLCIGFCMNGTMSIPYVFSLAVGKPEIAARTNYYALFAVLPVTVLLVFHFGIAGAGFSWVFYHLFAYAYMMPRACSECLGIPVWGWYLHVFKVFVMAGLTYGGAWAIMTSLASFSNLSLGLGYVLASIAFVAAAYRLIGDELRETLRRLTFQKPAPASTSLLV